MRPPAKAASGCQMPKKVDSGQFGTFNVDKVFSSTFWSTLEASDKTQTCIVGMEQRSLFASPRRKEGQKIRSNLKIETEPTSVEFEFVKKGEFRVQIQEQRRSFKLSLEQVFPNALFQKKKPPFPKANVNEKKNEVVLISSLEAVVSNAIFQEKKSFQFRRYIEKTSSLKCKFVPKSRISDVSDVV